jgi:hypothetical protein
MQGALEAASGQSHLFNLSGVEDFEHAVIFPAGLGSFRLDAALEHFSLSDLV